MANRAQGRAPARAGRQRGLTLVELVVTLTVVLLVSGGFSALLPRFLQENRMTAEVNQFVTALHLARSEAVKQGRRVLLCPSRDGERCGSGSDWPHGWLLLASADRERDAVETLTQHGRRMGSGISMQTSRHRQRIVFHPDGSAGGSNASFTFCDRRRLARPRVICLSATGRPRLSFRTCNRQPIECT